jgi:hypothetical protein
MDLMLFRASRLQSTFSESDERVGLSRYEATASTVIPALPRMVPHKCGGERLEASDLVC